jgi:serine/threonine protein kinase
MSALFLFFISFFPFRLADFQVALLSRVRHKNLVELVGYCIENGLVLVYEFMSGGSLYDSLFGKPLVVISL